ncbi:hypothetical protein [Epilithonimonas xixisoli]|uniref:Uncharacterized protein n=1 Tax=Epilithonimonas xixisoli TaxID=1476462 RepID=A0A4R8IH48_9FLAO|nr:hypothetical protein [Epilithonimonas xixisoli]TDX86165.1 hypothetical protein B0I22_0275 [Epilithonimonas xixisoli]
MAKVDINIIKEWFRNLKKPNQDQFWAWLDSFRHKDDKIPMEDVTNLTQTLTKKADLVGGVVPPHQLPFMIAGNEVLEIGSITATHNRVSIAVHESGSNKVRIDGQILVRDFPDSFLFTSVTAGSKFLRVVAKNATGLFFLKEGIESGEPQEPSLDAGELHVRLILITPEGNVIDPEMLTGFKEKAEDNWKKTYVFSSTTLTLEKSDVRTRFLITRTFLSGVDPVDPIYNVRGIRLTDKSREIEFLIKNDTPENVFLQQNGTVDWLVGFSEDYTLKPGTWIFAKYNKTTDKLDILKVGTSESMTVVVTDNTLKGSGNVGNPLGLSDLKNAEIAGKVDKTATPTQSIASAVAIGQMTADEKLHVNGRVKANSIVLTENIGTPVPWELGRKDGVVGYADASGVWRSLASLVLEHDVLGVRVEATISGSYAIDLKAGSHFALTATAPTAVSFANMIATNRTCSLTMTLTGSLITLPSWLEADPYSDNPDALKVREYSIVIKRGGSSPLGRFSVVNK